ncbi:MAG: phosphotransferase, partial [Chromatiales bacterium]|nr:phosphotransferase [Chromatiales bacterium]
AAAMVESIRDAGVPLGKIDDIVRLKGLTNRNYRVDTSDNSFVIRLPGTGTDEYIDRRAEANNARLAADWGLAPPLVYSDISTGVSLSAFVRHGKTLSATDCQEVQTLERIAQLLHRLHSNNPIFASTLPSAQLFDTYLEIASRTRGLHEVCSLLRQRALPILRQQTGSTTLTPCHVDPNPANFLDDGDRLWLVDWEYSANTNPMWDLACLSLEANLSRSLRTHLLESYQPIDTETIQSDFENYVRWVGLINLAWSAAQIGQGNDNTDFLEDFHYRLNQWELEFS